ncbi:MAG: SGNH/GDSL hydrolase family protein [Christensenellaceae bacterium]|nr:SGNH/GDSL hydrolase family protein [Christensenellaceae bacterium]MDD6926875.1 SGNH/GDSL hydrolase family protein [bacterium]MDY2851674.1 SGNH/GDSL hydrolase family protein [Christensenellaceae bacterium]
MTDDLYSPFWNGKVTEESVILVKTGNEKPKGNLLFPPCKILKVTSFDGEKEFCENDYSFSNNVFFAEANSTLPFMTEDMTRGEGKAKEEGLGVMDGLVFTEGTGIVKYQIKVSYLYDAEKYKWGVLPEKKAANLKNFYKKGNAGERLGILLYGDSIAAGCHASSVLNYPPYLPIWGKTISEKIGERFGVETDFTNISVGGYISRQGLENIDEKLSSVTEGSVDLAILHFGMNDGSWKVTWDEYKSNMQKMIDTLRKHSPECDILIISNLVANPLCTQDTELTASYLSADRELEKENDRTAVVDMTSVCLELLKTKKGLDLYANDINHPTDFFVRLFVTYVTESIL